MYNLFVNVFIHNGAERPGVRYERIVNQNRFC